ncbi:MAG: methyltransferase domain-containing protein [Gammaproteobacteria bacterium]|nr:methyltransferase domain-containing protein [Gammaproteobacteria bacterium]
MSGDDTILRQRYESIALSKDDKTTASDYLLRELEIDLGLEYMRDGDTVLDVGCGLGYALRCYATRRRITAHGLDYAENMVNMARERLAESDLEVSIDFRQGSVAELPYDDAQFDVITSHRCLMALLDWDLQKTALTDLHRVLKPGGILVLMEGTFDGLDRLNYYRRMFGLGEIDASGKDRLLTLKFHESQLLEYVDPMYELVRVQRFGMYYFLTRIIQPLLAAPEPPRYDHPLNEVAREIAKRIPDFEGIGHLVGYILKKRQ